MRYSNKTIYKDKKILRTENENEDDEIVTNDYYYNAKGLLHYTYSTQNHRKPEGKI
ncbi:MAG: hypothetical protein K1X86_15660 [Ignavibacteria bacterium]|nr:hypothetical protein [Ignavibacteria bacterium]